MSKEAKEKPTGMEEKVLKQIAEMKGEKTKQACTELLRQNSALLNPDLMLQHLIQNGNLGERDGLIEIPTEAMED